MHMFDELDRIEIRRRMLEAGLMEPKNINLDGLRLTHVFDIEKVLGSDPDLRNDICDYLYQKFPDATCVAGTGCGGIILASTLSSLYNMKACYVREKTNGNLQKMLEGYEPGKGDRVAVVNDIYAGGGDFTRIKLLLEPKTNIESYNAVIYREEWPSPRGFEPFSYMFRSGEFLVQMG